MSILATTSFPRFSRTRSLERESRRRDPWERDCSLPWLSNRTGTSVEDGARKSNNCLDQWQSGKLGIRSRVQSFSRAFLSSTDVPVLLLNISLIKLKALAKTCARSQENSQVRLNPEQNKCSEFEGVLHLRALVSVILLSILTREAQSRGERGVMGWSEERRLSPFRFPPAHRPSRFPWSRFSFRPPRTIQTETTRDESGLCLFQAPVQIVMCREKRAVSCHRPPPQITRFLCSLGFFPQRPTFREPCTAIVRRTEIWCSYIGWNQHRLRRKRNLLGQEWKKVTINLYFSKVCRSYPKGSLMTVFTVLANMKKCYHKR